MCARRVGVKPFEHQWSRAWVSSRREMNNPSYLEMLRVNRVVGDGQLVDELRLAFTHTRPMPWFLPDIPPTFRKLVVDVVVIAQFRGDKLACERIYWDHANVLRQVGLLNV